MELYEALQSPLKSAINGKDIPSIIADRLMYLWQSAHQTLGTGAVPGCTKLSHQLSHQFASLANEYMVDLPDHVKDRLCPRCFVLKLPSINTVVRVIRVSRNSGKNRQVNKNSPKTKRLKNVVCMECMTCKYKYKYKPCCLRKGKNKPKIEVSHENDNNNNTETIQSKVKFSFLDSMHKTKPDEPAAMMNTPAKAISLIELEKINKKNKKLEKRNSLTPSSMASPIGLNALQNLLGSAKKTM